MRPKVFVVQPIPAEPLAVLEEVAGTEVFFNEPPQAWHPSVPAEPREMDNVRQSHRGEVRRTRRG
jgi:hypothetical protein